MEITVRRACEKDCSRVLELLSEVLEIHAAIRPDIFKSGTTKYTDGELIGIFENPDTPVFVAVDEEDRVLGYSFTVVQEQPFSTTMKDFKTLYIDDLCVDSKYRGQHIGKQLYDYVINYARSEGFYDVTLNVWEGNDSARAFYDKMGMGIKETTMETIL